MKYFNKFRSYLLEDKLEIRVYKDRVNVVNYESVGHFDENKIIIYYKEGNLIVHGQNLVVSRLMNTEILIIGQIKNIELG